MNNEQETIVLGIVGIKNMGEYDSQISYEKLNVVTYQGSTYCALKDTKGNLPTNSDYWQLYAEKGGKGDTGPKPVKGVDYFTNDDIQDIEEDLSDVIARDVSESLGTLTSVTPLVATSTDEMVDTTRIYVNTSDGYWYWYNGSNWVQGDIYQGTAIPDNDMKRLNDTYAEIKDTTVSDISNGEHGFYRPTSPYNFYNDNNSRTSDYIICQGYTKLEYKTFLSSGGFEIVFFDRNKAILPDISITGDSARTVKTINIPPTAYYVRLSCYGSTDYTKAYIKLYLENNIIDKINDNTSAITNNLNEINIIETICNDNKQNNILTLPLMYDGYVVYDTGKINNVETSINEKNTGLIICKGYSKIRYKTYITNSGAEIAFYNKNKEYLNELSIRGDSSLNIKTIDVPNDAYYVIMSKYYSGVNDFFISLYSDNYIFKNTIANKNILIFGDSITDCANVTVNDDYETSAYSWPNNPSRKMWPWLLNRYFCCKEVRNYALSGATYSKQSNYTNKRSSLIDQVTIAINDKNNPNDVFSQNSFTPDIIIFAAGTNQYGVGSYVNAMNKTVYEDDAHTININSTLANLDQTKEIEAARYCFMKIKNEWPMAQIYVVLPIQRMSRDQLTNTMQIELPKLAERYGAVIINGCDNGIVQEGNLYQGEGTTLSDGLHPNQNGQYLMTRQIYKSIESNYFDYSVFQ